MDIKKKYGVDKNAMVNGVKLRIAADGTCVILARNGNKNFQKVLKAKVDQAYLEKKTSILLPEESTALSEEAFVETILLGWEGITEDGKPVPYSQKEALRFIREYPDFYDMVLRMSSDMDNFLLDQKKETEKNSDPSSLGS